MRSMPTRLADSASSTRMYRSLDASSLCPFSNGTPAVGSTTHSASAAATRRPTQCARQKYQAASEQSRSFIIIDQRAGRPALRVVALTAESWSDKSFESATCGHILIHIMALVCGWLIDAAEISRRDATSRE
jgi:hypothetical protein